MNVYEKYIFVCRDMINRIDSVSNMSGHTFSKFIRCVIDDFANNTREADTLIDPNMRHKIVPHTNYTPYTYIKYVFFRTVSYNVSPRLCTELDYLIYRGIRNPLNCHGYRAVLGPAISSVMSGVGVELLYKVSDLDSVFDARDADTNRATIHGMSLTTADTEHDIVLLPIVPEYERLTWAMFNSQLVILELMLYYFYDVEIIQHLLKLSNGEIHEDILNIVGVKINTRNNQYEPTHTT